MCTFEKKTKGCVFRLDPDMTLHRMIEDVSIPNGMGCKKRATQPLFLLHPYTLSHSEYPAPTERKRSGRVGTRNNGCTALSEQGKIADIPVSWERPGSPDDKTMYFTDSPSRGIYAYDYDSPTGTISNRRIFYQLDADEPGVLDGCTIDTEGNLWAAVHEGSRVVKLSPQGEVVGKVTLPAWKITCPAFGGKELDTLFVTTAGVDAGEETPEGSRDHGAVFRIKTAAKGARPNKFGAF